MSDGTLATFPPVIQEALCVFEAFRRLGFQADDIYMVHDDHGMGILLKSGGREFNVRVGEVPVSGPKLGALWEQAAEAWNSAPQHEIDALWRKSAVLRNGTGLCSALILHGFPLGRTLN